MSRFQLNLKTHIPNAIHVKELKTSQVKWYQWLSTAKRSCSKNT